MIKIQTVNKGFLLPIYKSNGHAFFSFPTTNINIDYRKPASMGDTLELYLGLEKIGSKSAVFYQEIRLKGTDTVVANAEVLLYLLMSIQAKLSE